MGEKRKIEIFSAGCSVCDQTIEMVKSTACRACEVSVLDMKDQAVAQRARELGIASVPAVMINGKLADCCSGGGANEETLRAMGLGQPA